MLNCKGSTEIKECVKVERPLTFNTCLLTRCFLNPEATKEVWVREGGKNHNIKKWINQEKVWE